MLNLFQSVTTGSLSHTNDFRKILFDIKKIFVLKNARWKRNVTIYLSKNFLYSINLRYNSSAAFTVPPGEFTNNNIPLLLSSSI